MAICWFASSLFPCKVGLWAFAIQMWWAIALGYKQYKWGFGSQTRSNAAQASSSSCSPYT